MAKSAMLFLGYNNMRIHKRGVENVIHFQSLASRFSINYYIHWDTQTKVYHYDSLICIGIRKNAFWYIGLNILLCKLKKKHKKIFIHSHNPLMSIMSLYQSNLFTVHDALYYLMTATKHKLNIVFWFLEKILYLRCSYVHFISEYTKKKSLYQWNKNYSIISNTSHFETFKGDNISIGLKKFNPNVIKVFAVRSIEERALINLIIGVAKKLKTEKIEFLVAGKGPLLDFYRDEIKRMKLENIYLLGYVDDNDLIQYYKDSDVILVPAAYGEGFGLPIIEGYLFDKPVIASNVCAIPEVIIFEEYLFENTVDSIISKINFATTHDNIHFRAYYNDKFSNKIVLKKMDELYMKLL
ncbi:glycosyltransferase [Flavobacterium sp. RS13.1]|uniref:glycosyltransferase n=1 Tax=Flavobacterium sp. RS13.1 TaxID=3400345 RepID=UPI003AAEED4E